MPRTAAYTSGLLGVMCALCSCTASGPASARPERWLTYRDPARHFSLQYPETWSVVTGCTPVMHYRDTFVSLNSVGVEGLRITQQKTGPTTWQYNADTTLAQLPPGCAYMDIGWWEGPGPVRRFAPGIEEMSGRDLSGVLPEAVEHSHAGGKLTSKTLRFSKWGRRWSIWVYHHEPVSAQIRQLTHRVLESVRFDPIPVGDETWAIGEARKCLPPEADPDAYFGRGGSKYRYTQAKRVGDDVLVTFTKSDPDGAAPDESWRFRVTARGEVIPVKDDP